MMNNRILRYFQRPQGVYNGSVFYQLSGGIGPSSLAVDPSGNLYVGQFDVQDSGSEGCVYIISPAGKLIGQVIVDGPEISGVAVRYE
jgi:sugar lactone lactonase YvrE